MSDEVTPPGPPKGTPEYDAYMIEVATKGGVDVKGAAPSKDGPPTEEAQTKPVKPDWLDEKFWDAEKGEIRAEALAKSYRELEKARSRAQQAAPAKAGEEPNKDGAPPVPADLFAKAQQEFAEKQELTAETYEALAKAGIPRETVDAYVEGQRARAELVKSQVFSAAGGEENYSKLTAWAAENLTEEQIDAFNTAVDSGNLRATIGAVANLRSLFDAANGKRPTGRIENGGGAGNAPAPEAFRSRAEMTKAMSDPRYKTDPAYRADVAAKVAGAAKRGIDLLV